MGLIYCDDLLLWRRRFRLWCCDAPGRDPMSSGAWTRWRRAEAPGAPHRRSVYNVVGSWRTFASATDAELESVISQRDRTRL